MLGHPPGEFVKNQIALMAVRGNITQNPSGDAAWAPHHQVLKSGGLHICNHSLYASLTLSGPTIGSFVMLRNLRGESDRK